MMKLNCKRERWVAGGIVAALLGVAMVWTSGCASKKADPVLATEKEDLSEYREAAADALRALQAVAKSFDKACGERPCPPKVLETFNKDVQRLEIDSFRLRARALAMKTVGEKYFDEWHAHLAAINDPVVRQTAIERHDVLQKSFEKIRELSHQTREAYGQYIAGLHRVRNALEKDPNAAAGDALKAPIQSTRENGQKVLDGLTGVIEELKADWAILKPIKANP
jgi:hypothetical protein